MDMFINTQKFIKDTIHKGFNDCFKNVSVLRMLLIKITKTVSSTL
jgi:hypothetical protein